MNINVLEEEIETLNAELRAATDPTAQERIKELIDKRYRAVEAATKAQQEIETPGRIKPPGAIAQNGQQHNRRQEK